MEGVRQGLVLGFLWFSIYLNALFLFLTKDIDVCNFANDMTPLACDQSFEVVKSL